AAPPHVLVSANRDDEDIPLAVFRLDTAKERRQVWSKAASSTAVSAKLYRSAKWGGVLVTRYSRPHPRHALGFEWVIDALQLGSGKSLAAIAVAPDVEFHAEMLLS